MKVDFNFKHVDSSEALMQYAQERLEKIEKFELKPMDVKFTVSKHDHDCIVEVSVIEGRRKFRAEGVSDDFYRSVEMVVNKLTRQLSKDKSRVKNHKNPERSVYGKIARLNDQLEPDYMAEYVPERPLKKVG